MIVRTGNHCATRKVLQGRITRIAAVLMCLLAVGGRLIYRGAYRMPVIGDEDWDDILLVEYPSIAAFFEMQRDKDYQAIVHHRTEGLSDSRLWATRQE